MQVRVPEEGKKLGTCGCGRSPTGDCCGWHGLSEEDFRLKLAEYESKKTVVETDFNKLATEEDIKDYQKRVNELFVNDHFSGEASE
jgi:hypothetical protein